MQQILLSILWVLCIDVVLIGLLAAALAPLAIFKKAAFAVLKRNFIAYFSNPTGYVFLCVFVLLTSIFAFCDDSFFTSNLANLDQLNRYLPVVMLAFIPAITMAVWAEERRQGTDELLLTLPATDFDIVFGKYLAAASIFTASLVFSQIASLSVLITLSDGTLDTGLLFSTYAGYWLMGLAMLAIGMVPSFLTSNLTVAFILGVLINSPLVGLGYADQILPARWSAAFSQWGLLQQFSDFGRGMITLGSATYFVTLIVTGLYLSMVLIGRRHWLGGRDGSSFLGHYMIRVLSILAIGFGVNFVLATYDPIRVDLTEKRANSLSPDTVKLIRELAGKDTKFTVYIDAFTSAQPPPQYVRTKYELTSLLKEFQARSNGKIKVRLHENLEPFSEEAAQAEKRFGIKPQPVRTRERGAMKNEDVIMGAAFTYGLQKVVVPFIDSGIPVEYELIRSINTVAQGTKKKLGVVRTDAQLFGGFSFAGGQPQQIPKELIVEELEKQYEVEEVDPTSTIDPDKYDVLLVVQPSSLGPQELDNVVDVIKKGTPSAVFEDPLPRFMPGVPGTGQPKRQNPMAAMMGGGGPPPPKGDIRRLWNTLGIKVPGNAGMGGMSAMGPGGPMFEPDIIWQDYNPYRKLQISEITPEWVFIRPEMPGGNEPFNPKEPVSAGLEELLFVFPGAISKDDDEIGFEKLVTTGNKAGTIKFEDLVSNRGDPRQLYSKRKGQAEYIIAARIFGKTKANPSMAGDGFELAQKSANKDKDEHEGHDHEGHDHAGHDHADGKSFGEGEKKGAKTDDAKSETKNRKPGEINVIYVADIDCLSSVFVSVRAQPPDSELNFHFDDVTFVLNVIDVLSGDDKYVNIRKPRTKYSTLKGIEAVVDEARVHETEEREKFEKQKEEKEKEAEENNNKAVEKYQQVVDSLQEKQRKGEEINIQEIQDALRRLAEQKELAQRRIAIEKERIAREFSEKTAKIRRDMDLNVLNVQRSYKVWAVVLPPIPPLLVGLVVFVRRRLREREGISKSRLL